MRYVYRYRYMYMYSCNFSVRDYDAKFNVCAYTHTLLHSMSKFKQKLVSMGLKRKHVPFKVGNT